MAQYNISCTVSGSRTGHRTALLKVMGEVYETDDKDAAERKVAECRERLKPTGDFGPVYGFTVVPARQ